LALQNVQPPHPLLGSAMSALDETITKRIGKLIRMFGSSFEPEAHTALRKMKGLLDAEGLTFNDIAVVVENHQGEIEERKYSDTDAEILFAKGVEKGRTEGARAQTAPPEFYDADGCPRWNEIALFCQKNDARLRSEWEREFVNDMAGKTLCREPS
jgi:hypothetical protein